MRILFLLLLAIFWTPLWSQKNRLDVTAVAPGFWVHTTYGKFGNSYFPANGLIVEKDNRVWIVDTGWGKKPARKLLRWVKKHLHKPVELVIITHAHDDRSGGVDVFKKQGISAYMTVQTAEILQKETKTARAYVVLDETSATYLQRQMGCQWYFPGAGHAPDNIVVYFENVHLLFGGCFIKSTEAQNLGNLADANIAEWPVALRRVQNRFPQIRIVVPGHQAWGGTELLDHTLKLLETNPK